MRVQRLDSDDFISAVTLIPPSDEEDIETDETLDSEESANPVDSGEEE